MLTYIKITGFKSFYNFEMAFTPLTVIAGANASGKSNLFDALKLLARLAETDLKTAFGEQRGNPSELFTQYDDGALATEMAFTVEMLVNREVKDNWGEKVDLNSTRLRYQLTIARKANLLGLEDLSIKHELLEKIKAEDDAWVKEFLPKDAKFLWQTKRAGGSKDPFIQTINGDPPAIKIRQDGRQGGKATPANVVAQTVLGGVNSVDFPHVFAAKEEMRSWRFLQLNPEDLREPTRQDIGLRDTLSPSGKNLAVALFRICQSDPYNLVEISRKLNSFLPNLTEVIVSDDKANQQYIVKVRGEDGKEFSSRVLSEGTLRLLALCVLEFDEKHTGLLCFEEPENGIHPFRLKAMAQLLKDLSADFSEDFTSLRQVIVNTHSSLLVREIVQLQAVHFVSVWLARIDSLITDIGEKRMKIKVTRMNPVTTERLLNVPATSEPERKFTLAEFEKYLQTTDMEKAINATL